MVMSKMRFLLQPVLAVLLVACDQPRFPITAAGHADAIHAWQQQRAAGLKAEDGWLSLVGLYWLEPGRNDFGSGEDNDLVLENAGLARHAGFFAVADGEVVFHAAPGAGITQDGKPVSEIRMIDDHDGDPTLLAAGSLRFYVIARAGNLGIRVRDLDNPARRNFKGLDYFPVSLQWRKEARFEAWPQPRGVKIVNVLGMVDEMTSPGELVFEHGGREFRVTALAEPGDAQWFVMIADGTSGRTTYGAGRYLYVDPPADGPAGDIVLLDFNKAYNPPCAFTALATCPLPPPSNRLPIDVTAGEKNYSGAAWHAAE